MKENFSYFCSKLFQLISLFLFSLKLIFDIWKSKFSKALASLHSAMLYFTFNSFKVETVDFSSKFILPNLPVFHKNQKNWNCSIYHNLPVVTWRIYTSVVSTYTLDRHNFIAPPTSPPIYSWEEDKCTWSLIFQVDVTDSNFEIIKKLRPIPYRKLNFLQKWSSSLFAYLQ